MSATKRTKTGRSAEFVDAAGVEGQYAQQVEVIYSNVAASTYATSGLRYIPISKVASPNQQYFIIQFRATRAGRLRLKIGYAMSVSNGGDTVWTPSHIEVADGEDVNGSPTTDGNVTLTPGTGATRKTWTLDTGVNVQEGDDVTYKLLRADVAGDTHTGSFNLLSLLATVENA